MGSLKDSNYIHKFTRLITRDFSHSNLIPRLIWDLIWGTGYQSLTVGPRDEEMPEPACEKERWDHRHGKSWLKAGVRRIVKRCQVQRPCGVFSLGFHCFVGVVLQCSFLLIRFLWSVSSLPCAWLFPGDGHWDQGAGSTSGQVFGGAAQQKPSGDRRCS